MATSNSTAQRVSEFIITGFDHLPNHRLLGFLILITYSLVLVGSSANICIVVTDRRLHRPMYILICNLALVDIMFTTSASTTMISVLLAEVKTISYYSCISRMYIYHLGDIGECLALTLMAFDRMLAISNPLRYSSILTNRRTLVLIVLTWLLSFAAMGPAAGIADRLPYCQPIVKYVFCDYPALVRAACVNPEEYFLVSTILAMWLIAGHFPLILSTYVKIIYTVAKLSNRGKDNSQLISTCLSHFIVVVCYYLPKLISVLLTRIGVSLTLTERNAMLIVSTLVPSLMNPTVYFLRTKEIRNRLMEKLRANRVRALK